MPSSAVVGILVFTMANTKHVEVTESRGPSRSSTQVTRDAVSVKINHGKERDGEAGGVNRHGKGSMEDYT